VRRPRTSPPPVGPHIGAHRRRHLALARRRIATEFGHATVVVDEAESPLAWLARRRGRSGRALIETHQLQAGERLRADFTRANLMPHTTADWEKPVGGNQGGAVLATDAMVAARQRVRQALAAAGPEFSGLLLDVCCFLKTLPEVERERLWPARSGKVVLQLALERLARHYGYARQARGRPGASPRVWLAADERKGRPET
jgi:hypothetical protein